MPPPIVCFFISHLVQIKRSKGSNHQRITANFISHLVQIKLKQLTNEELKALLYIPLSSDKTILDVDPIAPKFSSLYPT